MMIMRCIYREMMQSMNYHNARIDAATLLYATTRISFYPWASPHNIENA